MKTNTLVNVFMLFGSTGIIWGVVTATSGPAIIGLQLIIISGLVMIEKK